MPSNSTISGRDTLTEPIYPAAVARQGPFSYSADGFHIEYTFRERGRSLRRLLFPEFFRSKEGGRKTEPDSSIVNEGWIESQLLFYGIDFNPRSDAFALKALLLTSVAAGLCDNVPPQVLNTRVALKEEYDKQMEAYRTNLKAYQAQEQKHRVPIFEACASPTEEAQCDLSLFLTKYFLDEHGNADRSKKSKIVLLPRFSDDYGKLRDRIECVPALHAEYGGPEDDSHTMVIGWNRAKVIQKACQVDKQSNDGREVVHSYHNWNLVWDAHRKHAEPYNNLAEPRAKRTFQSAWIDGHYAIRCPAIEFVWTKLSKRLQLRILEPGQLAVFDLGLVFGLMILRKTPRSVTRVAEGGQGGVMPYEQSDDSDSATEALDSDHEESEAEISDTSMSASVSIKDELGLEETGVASRDIDGTSDASYNPEDSESTVEVGPEEEHDDFGEEEEADLEGDGPDAESDSIESSMSGPPTKRHKKDDGKARRMYFQWRGYNTMTGAIQSDPENRNRGTLDFESDGATVFRGKMYMEIMGGQISFEGYRINGTSGSLTGKLNWDALSHLESDRAKAPKFEGG